MSLLILSHNSIIISLCHTIFHIFVTCTDPGDLNKYFFCYITETTVKQIEDAFKEFTARDDIAIVLISQYVSEPSL
jgi:hypothetical protein